MTNRRVKLPLLLSKLPKPAYEPTTMTNGRTSVSAKCEPREREGGDKREHTISPQTTQSQPVDTMRFAKKMSVKSWIIFRRRRSWEPRRPPPILLKLPPFTKMLTSSSPSWMLATSLLSSLSASSSLASGCESARYSVVKAENAERSAFSFGSLCNFSRQSL